MKKLLPALTTTAIAVSATLMPASAADERPSELECRGVSTLVATVMGTSPFDADGKPRYTESELRARLAGLAENQLTGDLLVDGILVNRVSGELVGTALACGTIKPNPAPLIPGSSEINNLLTSFGITTSFS